MEGEGGLRSLLLLSPSLKHTLTGTILSFLLDTCACKKIGTLHHWGGLSSIVHSGLVCMYTSLHTHTHTDNMHKHGVCLWHRAKKRTEAVKSGTAAFGNSPKGAPLAAEAPTAAGGRLAGVATGPDWHWANYEHTSITA